jgi:hypothetical protein
MPTISGFTQTSSIQECEFELVVSDGELASLPDIVKVIIVPSFGTNVLELINPPFDPEKPTIVGFGGGYDCDHGVKWVSYYETSIWFEKANIVTTSGDWYHNRYEKYGDMLIVYLSRVAPNYHQPIQAIGFSAGNWPAIDVANYLNLTYADARYAVNRVTLLDPGCEDFPELVNIFRTSSVDGEQCWVDNYIATHGEFCSQRSHPTCRGRSGGEPITGSRAYGMRNHPIRRHGLMVICTVPELPPALTFL